jgi:multiple sugar transport system permease protein
MMPDLDRRETRSALGFLLPLAVFMSGLILLPVLGTVIDSLFRDVTFLDGGYGGLVNYRRMFEDPGFWRALRFTCLFALVSVPIEIVLGLAFALLLSEPLPLRGVLRACVLIPWAIPAAVSGRAFELIYHHSYGLANFLCRKLGLIEQPVNWLGSAIGAFFALVVADVWKTTPFVAIILLAGLSAIPEDLYLQARVDGAGILQRFGRITLPLLKPVLLVALLFRTIDALRLFDLVYVLTGGGPGGATTSLSMYGYDYFLAGDFGYGSAVSVALFVLALGLTLFYAKLSGSWKEVQ